MKKAFWDKKNPKKTSSKLTSAQKSAAKARAKTAGRPYPNLVDNGSATIQVASRRMLDDTITYSTSKTTDQEGRCSVRSAGRYHRVSLTPTGANWFSAIGIDIEYSEQGTR